MRKKILSLALAVVIGFSSTNVTAFAQESEGKEIETIEETVQETEEVEVEQSTDNEDKEYGSTDTTETEVITSTEELVEESSTYIKEEMDTISTTVAEEETIEVVSEEVEVPTENFELTEEELTTEEMSDQMSSSELNTVVKNKILSYKALYPEGTKWDEDDNFEGYGSCIGFAVKLSMDLFGNFPYPLRKADDKYSSKGWTCYHVTPSNYNSLVVEPGDILDCPTGSGSGVSHTAMVLSVDNGKITCVQANKNWSLLVYWNQPFNYNAVGSSVTLKEIYDGYKGYIKNTETKIFRLWKPSDSLKQNAQAYEGTGSSTLRISGATIPTKIKQGKSFSCEGKITSNYNIIHVGGYILQFIDGKEHVVYSKTVKPNTTSYSLLNNAVDKALLFGELPAGTYYYKITAHDSSGNKRTLINEPFDVTGTSTLRIGGQNYPTNLNVGSNFKSEGIIRSNYNIVHVGCYILKIEDGNETVMYSKTISPNATSFNLDNEEIHNALQFQNLPAGTYYYKITAHDSSDKRSNMVNKEFTVDATESTLSISGGTYPGTLTKGTVWNSKGTISSNYNIEHIGCYILQITDGNETVMYSKTLKPNATSYNLDNSEVHNSLLFHELPVGDYFYSITAHDISGKRSYMIYEPFSVVNACEFDNRSSLSEEGIYYTPYMKVLLDVSDTQDIDYFRLYVYDSEQGELLGIYKILTSSFKTENGRYIYDGRIGITGFGEGKYEWKLTAVCNEGIEHDIGNMRYEYKFPILTFISTSDEEPFEIKYDHEARFIMPDEPIREGYIFNGWYTEENGQGTEFTADTEISSNLTLYAYWTIDKSTFGEVLEEDVPDDGIIPDGIWIAGIDDQTYTDSNIKQNFRVYDGKKRLKQNTDYTITYKNNKNAYTYTDEDYAAFEENLKLTGKRTKVGTFDPKKAPQIIVKMKGNYSGSRVIYFKIEQADITGDAFETGNLTVTYTGKKQTPAPKLTWNGKALKYGTDFYIPEYDVAKKDKTAFKETGTYNLTITGKKNFTGEIPFTLTISESAKQIAMNKVKVAGIKNMPWTGDQIKQTGFIVKYSKDVLSEENGDYTIEWGENTDAGTGSVTFIGTGTDEDEDGFSYIGSKKVFFKINGTAMSKVKVSGVKKSYPYTGTEIKPEASLTYKPSKNAQEIPLTEGTHYTAVYQKNVDKGTATILFTGLASGGYTGTKKVTFKITSAGVGDTTEGETTIENIHISFADTENIQDGVYVAPYMKGGAKPEVIVTSGEKTLEEGKDYKVSYSNNKKPALSTDAKAPTVTVTGKGNYKGSKSETFTIEAKALSNENGITVVAKDKVENLKKNGYRQSFKVYDKDGKVLGNKDYNTSTVTYTLIQTIAEDGTVSEVNEPLDKNSIIPAGSVIKITVQGKGIYAGGEASGTYRILEKNYDISKATIQINNQPYTGNAILITDQSQFKVGKVFIKMGNQKKELILGQDIEVVRGSYVKNVNKGTAKVTFRGINDFGGTKTVSFKIGARSITDFWKGIYAKMAELWN